MDIFLIIFIVSVLILSAAIAFYMYKKNKKPKYVSVLFSDTTGYIKLPDTMITDNGLFILFTNQNEKSLVLESGNTIQNAGPNVWDASSTQNFNLGSTQAPFYTTLDADASGDLILYGTSADQKPVIVWKASTSGMPFVQKNNGGPYKLKLEDSFIFIYDKSGNLVWSTDKSSQKVLSQIAINNVKLSQISKDNLKLLQQVQKQKQENALKQDLANFGPFIQEEVKYPCSMLPNNNPISSGVKSVYSTPSKTYPCQINNTLSKLESEVNFQPPLY